MRSFDYSGIIRRSWDITIRNKWLWVYGLMIAATSGSSLRGSGGGGGGTSSSDTIKGKIPEDLPAKSEQVLGAMSDAATAWLRGTTPTTWIMLAGIVILLAILAVIIGMVVKSWATAGLIAGLRDAQNGQNVTLRSSSPQGLAKIKDIIIFGIISGLIVTAVFIAVGLLVAPGFLILGLLPLLGIIWLVLSGITAVTLMILAVILTAMISVYAERLIVLHGLAPWDAWKKGLTLARGNFLPTLIMGLINNAVGCAAGAVITLPLIIGMIVSGAVLVGIGAVAWQAPDHSGWTVIPVIALTLSGMFGLFVLLQSALNAILTVWRFGVWNEFFSAAFESGEVQP